MDQLSAHRVRCISRARVSSSSHVGQHRQNRRSPSSIAAGSCGEGSWSARAFCLPMASPCRIRDLASMAPTAAACVSLVSFSRSVRSNCPSNSVPYAPATFFRRGLLMPARTPTPPASGRAGTPRPIGFRGLPPDPAGEGPAPARSESAGLAAATPPAATAFCRRFSANCSSTLNCCILSWAPACRARSNCGGVKVGHGQVQSAELYGNSVSTYPLVPV